MLSCRSSPKMSVPRLGSSSDPVSSAIDPEAREIPRCFPDTIMATARLDAKMGSYTDVLLRSSREEHLGVLDKLGCRDFPVRYSLHHSLVLRKKKTKKDEDSFGTAVERKRSLPPHFSQRLLLPRVSQHLRKTSSGPLPMSKQASVKLKLSRRSLVTSATALVFRTGLSFPISLHAYV